MPRGWSRPRALKAAAGVVALLLTPPPGARAWGSVEHYIAVAEDYREGRLTQPRQALSQWSLLELDDVVRRFRDRGRTQVQGVIRQLELVRNQRAPLATSWCPSAEDIGSGTAEAAILLHTDAVISALRAGSPVEAEHNLRHAEDLLESVDAWLAALREAPSLPTGCEIREGVARRDWYLTMTLVLIRVGRPAAADALLHRGLRGSPTDEETTFVAGVVKEALATLHTQLGQRKEASGALREAEKLYRVALAVEPGRAEARLRLGRVLCETGRCNDAEPQLLEALAEAPDAGSRYLAALFLGRARESRGRLDEAIAAYRRAVSQRPHAQAARLALAHALQHAGDGAGARGLIREVLADPWHDLEQAEAADPWSLYDLGPSVRADQLLAGMRARVRSRQ